VGVADGGIADCVEVGSGKRCIGGVAGDSVGDTGAAEVAGAEVGARCTRSGVEEGAGAAGFDVSDVDVSTVRSTAGRLGGVSVERCTGVSAPIGDVKATSEATSGRGSGVRWTLSTGDDGIGDV
jgi:hypothetical protein